MKKTTFGYKQTVTSEMLNERFADLAGGSILNGFRLTKGTGNYSISLRRMNDKPSAAITEDGVRVMETADVIDAVVLRPNTNVLDRFDVIYVAWRQDAGVEVTFDYTVVEGVPGLPVNIETKPANRLPLGYVRLRTNTAPTVDDLTSLDIGVKFGTLYANGMIINGTPILTKTYVDGEVQKNKERIVSTETEIAAARKTYPTLNDMFVGEMAQKANVLDIEQKFNLIGSASPKGVYTTLAALQTAFPTGNTNIYVVTADGKWYYWSGSAWTAGGVYQTTGLADTSITTDKLAFNALVGKKGKNLFDKSKVQTGKYISAANGTVQNSTGFTASDWIPIQPNTIYSLYKRNQLAFYDVNKAFLAFSDNTTATTVTSPANAVFLRITTLIADVDLQQVEQGSARTSYEKFGVYLDEETVAPFGPDKIKDNSITKAKLNFVPIEAESSKNLFNKNSVTANKYISASNGVELTPSAGVNVSASDWIAIKPNTQYTISKYNQTAVYDANKIYIASTGGVATNSVYTFTTPSNAAWLRMTTDNANLNVQQLELGAAATTYAEFGASIPSSALSRNSIPDGLITPEKLSFGIGKYDETGNRLLLPPKMFFVDNLPLPLYRDNIFADNSVNLSSIFKTALINVDFNNGYLPTYQYFDEDIKLDPAKLLGTFTIGVKQYTFPDTHYYGDILKSTVSATSKTGRTPKIINLGDSLTNRNVPARLKAKLEGYGVAPSVYGTMANGGGVNGEGREGWTFSQFIGKSNQIGGVAIARQTTAGAGTLQTNPFLKLADATDLANNPTWCFRNTGVFTEKSYAEDTDNTGDFYIFDFGYYLATQGFAIPDVVTIALSTNAITDLSGNRLALEVMIKQIKKACPSCKIGVIPTGAWGSSATGNAVWKTNVVPWVENCITDVKTYQSSITGLDIVPIWCHVNRDFNFLYGAATSLSNINATKKAQRGDYIHWGESGKAEYINSLSSYVMNVI